MSRSWLGRLLLAVLLAGLLSLLSGCASAPSWNPLRTIFGRKAAAEQRVERKVEETEKKVESAEDKLVTAAQIELAKATFANTRAVAKYPSSRSVSLASRTTANAAALLAQRRPLSAAAQSEAIDLATSLLSEETSRREAAEAAQRSVEQQNTALSLALEKVRGDLAKIQGDLTAARQAAREEAARNLELANELRIQKLCTYGGYALSALLGLATIAYKLNIGRLQQGAAEVLTKLGAKHGSDAEATARSALDAVLHTGEQSAISKVFTTLTKKT